MLYGSVNLRYMNKFVIGIWHCAVFEQLFYNFIQNGAALGSLTGPQEVGIDMRQPQGQNLLLPWKPAATDRHVFPPELCWSEHTTQHLLSNSPDGAVVTPNAHPTS